jgi:hypothetical protein
MKNLKLAIFYGLIGLLAIGITASLMPVRQISKVSAWTSNFEFESDFGSTNASQFSTSASGDDASKGPLEIGTVDSSAATPTAPEWFHQGWNDTKQSRLIGVSLEGQTSIPLAIKNLTQLLREEILRELGFANPSDPAVLPQLSPEFIGSRLIPKGHLLLLPYEDDVTREAAALRNQPPVPYYRGFAEASLGPNFFRLVDRWKRYPELRESLKWLGVSAGGILAAIALLLGYLKADHVTHSHYTKRLQTFFAIVLLAVAALIYWLL